MRTECMICDGCGRHDQIKETDARNSLMRVSDYLPDHWVMMKDGHNVKAYHSIYCAYDSYVKQATTTTQLAMFTEGESDAR